MSTRSHTYQPTNQLRLEKLTQSLSHSHSLTHPSRAAFQKTTRPKSHNPPRYSLGTVLTQIICGSMFRRTALSLVRAAATTPRRPLSAMAATTAGTPSQTPVEDIIREKVRTMFNFIGAHSNTQHPLPNPTPASPTQALPYRTYERVYILCPHTSSLSQNRVAATKAPIRSHPPSNPRRSKSTMTPICTPTTKQWRTPPRVRRTFG
jgi:hypothetical protein